MPATVLLRPATDASGAPLLTAARVDLVDSTRRPVQGARTTTGAPLVGRYVVSLAADDAPVSLDLVPQSQIARPSGAATWYRVRYTADGISEDWLIQVPDTDGPHEVPTLAEAAALPAGSVLAGRLPPEPPDDATAGWVLTLYGDPPVPTWRPPTTPTPDPDTIDGGTPSSTATDSIDGGTPSSTATETIDGGTP